jgi:uncharacterized glyoxalase superfamily protein PhnB
MKDAAAGEPVTSVFPVIRYRNVPAAVDWLCDAFGFERHRITTGDDGAISLAQLTFGTAMVMLGPVRKSGFDRYMRQPDEIGGAETQVCYCFVADANAHFVRAKTAGAEILFDLEDRTNGGRSYSCLDLEGHVWNFGTYDPWRPQFGREGEVRRRFLNDGSWRLGYLGGLQAVAMAAVVMAAVVMAAGRLPDLLQGPVRELVGAPPPNIGDIGLVYARLDRESDAMKAAKRAALGIQEQSRRAHNAMDAARGVPAIAQEQLGLMYDDKEAEDRTATEIRKQLAEVVSVKEVAERAVAEMRERLIEARRDKEAAEQAAKLAHDRLVSAWIRKTAAEKSARAAQRRLIRERTATGQNANPLNNTILFSDW